MKILGISAYYHDSAAAIVIDGEIVAALQEERFIRVKHDATFPVNAIKECLNIAAIEMNDLDAVVFYDKPFLKFERILETFYSVAPKGFQSFIFSMPLWIKEKFFLKKNIREELENIGAYNKKKTKLLFTEHHQSHAASAFYPSPFENAAILTIDGVGEWATASLCVGEGNKISVLRQMNFPDSVGLLYSAFTYYLGFKVNSGEYKLMGLAPYGSMEDPQTKAFIDIIASNLCTVFPDGSVKLNQHYFNFTTGLTMVKEASWKKLFGFFRRKPSDEIKKYHCNLALAIQHFTEDIVIKMASHLKEITGQKYLCMAGGVALNCVANGKLHSSKIFDDIFIQPASGDAGGALGAALSANFIYYGSKRKIRLPDGMSGALLGNEFDKVSIEHIARKYSAPFIILEEEKLVDVVSDEISKGKIVGWFNGKMEFGPRALGNRSILADPRDPMMQKKLNLQIKYREGFRPFAPIVLEEDASTYFDLESSSPYMMLVKKVKGIVRGDERQNKKDFDLYEQLYSLKSDIPAVTHVDYTARIQTVSRETNIKLYRLLKAFKSKTGCGALINTSFNLRGEPIVNTPEQAYICFMRSGMDLLVLGNYIFYKESQPKWAETEIIINED